MRYIEKRSNQSLLKAYHAQPYEGVEVVFFTRQGGLSTDEYTAGKLTGAYAGLNVGSAGQDDKEKVTANIQQAMGFIGSSPEKLYLLQSQYGAGVVKVTPETVGIPDSAGVKILKGDALMTDDPTIALGIVGADAHPIALKARKHDGSPVVALVVGSHHGLMRGILNETIKSLMLHYDINPDSIAIDIGPGLGPASIKNKEGKGNVVAEGTFSSTSYEIGLKQGMDYIAGVTNKDDLPNNPYAYYTPDAFHFLNHQDYRAYTARNILEPAMEARASGHRALAETRNLPPIFRAHPFDEEKIVIDIEALIKQTVVKPMTIEKDGQQTVFPGIKPEMVTATGLDTFARIDEFFSARGLEGALDKEAIAHKRNIDLTARGAKIDVHAHIGRNLTLIHIVNQMERSSQQKRS